MLESWLAPLIAFGGFILAVVARERIMTKSISDGDERNARELKKAEGRIHERINEHIDKANCKFDDLRDTNRAMFVGKEHFESSFRALDDQMKSMNKKLDLIIEKHLK